MTLVTVQILFYASVFTYMQLENTFLIGLFIHANIFKMLRPVLSSSTIFVHEYVVLELSSSAVTKDFHVTTEQLKHGLQNWATKFIFYSILVKLNSNPQITLVIYQVV